MSNKVKLDSNARKIVNKKLLIPRILTLLLAVAMAFCIFLPYGTATKEYAEGIQQYPDEIIIEELNLSAKDMENVSMAKFARIWFATRNQYWDPWGCVILSMIVVLIGTFSLAASIFAFFGKPIVVISLTTLVYGISAFQNWAYTYDNKIPSEVYNWGIAHEILPIIIVLTLVCAFCMLVIKKIIVKKQNNNILSEEIKKEEKQEVV